TIHSVGALTYLHSLTGGKGDRLWCIEVIRGPYDNFNVSLDGWSYTARRRTFSPLELYYPSWSRTRPLPHSQYSGGVPPVRLEQRIIMGELGAQFSEAGPQSVVDLGTLVSYLILQRDQRWRKQRTNSTELNYASDHSR
ncbi:hypothetical protein JG688_00017629, partial [Phytophthora aleatoria]